MKSLNEVEIGDISGLILKVMFNAYGMLHTLFKLMD